MGVKGRIAVLFALVVMIILMLVCGTVYYLSSANRTADIRVRLMNRAITTRRLLGMSGVFDSAMVRTIDASTSLALKEKVIEAYDTAGRRTYWYSENPGDSLSVDKAMITKARNGRSRSVYFEQGKKDAVICYYEGTVIAAAAYDETGRENLRHLRVVLISSFIGGVLVSMAGGYLFSLRLLRPVRKIADEVNDISARNLAKRIRFEGTKGKDEWNYLSGTLNELLNRLQESFEIQGRFIANASHELSTPLTSISSQLEVSLQRTRSIEEYRKVIASVYQDTRQLNRLTQVLLEFARASGTASGLSIDLIRIDEILLRLPAEMQRLDPRFDVRLDFDHLPEQEDDLLVFGNEELLLTAIRNIVSNACKYSEDHQAFVELVISATEIVVVVKDKGAGIAAEELEHIFQPFYRTEEGASKPGFGLGLPLARRIVQLHKGRVEVRSEPGKGSEFLIRLPHAGHA